MSENNPNLAEIIAKKRSVKTQGITRQFSFEGPLLVVILTSISFIRFTVHETCRIWMEDERCCFAPISGRRRTSPIVHLYSLQAEELLRQLATFKMITFSKRHAKVQFPIVNLIIKLQVSFPQGLKTHFSSEQAS